MEIFIYAAIYFYRVIILVINVSTYRCVINYCFNLWIMNCQFTGLNADLLLLFKTGDYKVSEHLLLAIELLSAHLQYTKIYNIIHNKKDNIFFLNFSQTIKLL